MSEDNRGQNSSAQKKGGDNKPIIIVGAIIIVLLVVVIILLLQKNSSGDSGAVQTDNGQTSVREVANESRMVLEEESAQSIMDEMREAVEEGMFECSMSMEWTFKDGESESKDAYVENSPNNRYPIYFDVTLDGSDEIIYSSPVIPVGSHLTGFKLDKPLSAGTYKAVCMYTLVQDAESQEPMSSAGFVITIVVEN